MYQKERGKGGKKDLCFMKNLENSQAYITLITKTDSWHML